MTDANVDAPEGITLRVSKLIAGSFFGLGLAAVLVMQFNQTPSEEIIDADVASLPSECSSASLISAPTSRQLSCLMDVKAEYGTFDCRTAKGFETRLKADVEQCEAKISACLKEQDAIQLEAVAEKTTDRKSKIIIKREPAKLSQLGRAQSPSETNSYFIQCDNTDGAVKWAKN